MIPPLHYTILKHERLTQMVAHVNNIMAEGWRPLGGICLVTEPAEGRQYYVQAMLSPNADRPASDRLYPFLMERKEIAPS